MTTPTQKAKALATAMHAGQVDKAGKPYIEHVARVAESGAYYVEATVGWLHDIVEDTPMTLDAIEALFGWEIAAAVDALTRVEGEGYFDYICRIKDAGGTARAVKILDLEDHLRFTSVIPASLIDRYEKAMKILVYP